MRRGLELLTEEISQIESGPQPESPIRVERKEDTINISTKKSQKSESPTKTSFVSTEDLNVKLAETRQSLNETQESLKRLQD